MECEPTLKPEVLNVATLEEFSAPVPSVVAPSLKVTVPVGAPLAGETTLTVAVNVTGWPEEEGFGADTNLVDVEPWFTVCANADEVLPERLSLPL